MIATTIDPRCSECGIVRSLHRNIAQAGSHDYVLCAGCAEGSPVPHEPSPRCESGKRPHCTCDVCF